MNQKIGSYLQNQGNVFFLNKYRFFSGKGGRTKGGQREKTGRGDGEREKDGRQGQEEEERRRQHRGQGPAEGGAVETTEGRGGRHP